MGIININALIVGKTFHTNPISVVINCDKGQYQILGEGLFTTVPGVIPKRGGGYYNVGERLLQPYPQFANAYKKLLNVQYQRISYWFDSTESAIRESCRQQGNASFTNVIDNKNGSYTAKMPNNTETTWNEGKGNGYSGIVDNYSNLPNAALHKGELWYVINTTIPSALGNTWYSDGSNWISSLTLIKTKGDILTFSTEQDILIVGTNGQVLSSDSTAPTGLKWISIVSGVSSVTGTLNRITASPTTGAVVVDIANTYVGQSSITTLGIITTGTWNASVIGTLYGGTGLSSYTTGDVLYASSSSVLSKLGIGSSGQVLTVAFGIPSWQTIVSGVSSVTGTTNRITVSPTTGAVIVDISASYVGQTSITTIGTITTGTWNATVITPTYGGTGTSSYTIGDILYASGVSALSKLGIGTSGQVLTVSAGLPSWQTIVSGVSSVSGTTNRITASPTTGAVVIDIAATYVGQISITTLGTITAGAWTATTIAAIYGGTGQTIYAIGDILYASTTTALSKLSVSTNGKVLTLAAGIPSWQTPTTGTVTSVSVISANGFSGSVATATTTPAITITTTITGLLYGNGTAIAAATTLTGLTFSSPPVLTVNLSTGIAGGQSVIGSTSTNSGLTIKATTGVGTTGADIIFVAGNNGATELARFINAGNYGFGTSTPGILGVSAYKYLTLSNTGLTGGGIFEAQLVTASATQDIEILGVYGYNGTTNVAGMQVNGDGSITSGNITFFTKTTAGIATERIRVNSQGRTGFGVTTITAIVHLKAGTATASTAPLKFTSGTLLTIAEAGAIEFLTDKFYATISSGAVRKEITLNDAALTSGTVPIATTNGRLTDSTFSTTTLLGNTYTPTATNVTNITASTPNNTSYLRVGNIVTVFGSVSITNTLAIGSQLDISLPIASNIGATTDVNGTGQSDVVLATNVIIKGEVTNDRASMFFTAAGVGGTGTIFYSFQYKVI